MIIQISNNYIYYMHKHNYNSWKQFMNNLKHSNEQTEELSKLYIVFHYKVKKTLQQSIINPNHNITPQINAHIQNIQEIIQKLSHHHQDEYLSKLSTKNLQNYIKHFQALIYMLNTTQKIQNSRNTIHQFTKVANGSNLTKKYLHSLDNFHHSKSISKSFKQYKQYTLNGELKKSQQRRINSRSKVRIKVKNNLSEPIEQPKPQTNTNPNINPNSSNFTNQIKQVKSVRDYIEKKGTQINFKKKYNNIQLYFQQKRNPHHLHQYETNYLKMINRNSPNKVESIQERQSINLSKNFKMFNEFNIKTKFMKEGVRKNIINTILSVKKELLNQFHLNNVNKMREVNQAQLIQLKKQSNQLYKQKKNSSMPIIKKATSLSKNTYDDKKTTLSLYPMQLQNKSKKKIVSHNNNTLKGTWWNEEEQNGYKNQLCDRFSNNKFLSYS